MRLQVCGCTTTVHGTIPCKWHTGDYDAERRMRLRSLVRLYNDQSSYEDFDAQGFQSEVHCAGISGDEFWKEIAARRSAKKFTF